MNLITLMKDTKAKTVQDMEGVEWNDILMYVAILAMAFVTIIEATR